MLRACMRYDTYTSEVYIYINIYIQKELVPTLEWYLWNYTELHRINTMLNIFLVLTTNMFSREMSFH